MQLMRKVIMVARKPVSQLIPLKPGAQTHLPERSSQIPPFKQIGQSFSQAEVNPHFPKGHAVDVKRRKPPIVYLLSIHTELCGQVVNASLRWGTYIFRKISSS